MVTGALLEFPLKGGGVWRVMPGQLQRWRETFPRLEVLDQLRSALDWLETHPTRMKTERGMPAFCSGWLRREARQGVVERRSVTPAPVHVEWSCPHRDPDDPGVPMHGSKQRCELFEVLPMYAGERARVRRGATS